MLLCGIPRKSCPTKQSFLFSRCTHDPFNYFIPRHRKYIGQHNQCSNISAAQDGKVGYNTAKYTIVFLYSYWLYFLWHGIKPDIYAERDFSDFTKTI